jgi:hypothetical protein
MQKMLQSILPTLRTVIAQVIIFITAPTFCGVRVMMMIIIIIILIVISISISLLVHVYIHCCTLCTRSWSGFQYWQTLTSFDNRWQWRPTFLCWLNSVWTVASRLEFSHLWNMSFRRWIACLSLEHLNFYPFFMLVKQHSYFKLLITFTINFMLWLFSTSCSAKLSLWSRSYFKFKVWQQTLNHCLQSSVGLSCNMLAGCLSVCCFVNPWVSINQSIQDF